ncbi:MAG: hypothetical protein NZ951_06485 [Dehalococcoidia bacterium]|nr:hypothetical protein [Dehalococcoidia bacterium]MDW8120614.1 hypothetical protein [Chloroflexota bacterium]
MAVECLHAEGAGVRRRRGKLVLAIVLVLLALLLRTDTRLIGPVQALALPYQFSLEVWEARNLLEKWLHWPREALPWRRLSAQERRALVRDYFATAREVAWLQAMAQRGLAPPTAEEARQARQRLETLQRKMDSLRPRVEEALEAELSTLLREEGLVRRMGPLSLLWPPVDIRFDQLPKFLALSPRDRILLQGGVLLRGDTPLDAITTLETHIHQRYNLSALVVDLGGIATYPSILSPFYSPAQVTEAMAHEWVHQYLFFFPLGWNYYRDPEVRALNEAVADLAGKELGARLMVRLGYAPPTRHPTPPHAEDFVTQTLRETRRQVEALLAQGQIEEAEDYMERQRATLARRGYYIRKLNQAYFAFYGLYPEHPAAVSPMGEQVRRVREASPSLGAFLRTMAGFGSYREFSAFYQAQVRP